MALELKLKVQNIYSDNGTFPSSDIVDNTGTYDATTNPGGYGSPNPARSDLDLYVFAYKKNYDSDDQELDVTISTPATQELWNTELVGDGHYRYEVIGTEKWVIGETYALDQVVYFNGKFYKATTAHLAADSNDPEDVGAPWEEITLETLKTTVYDNPDTYAVNVGSLDWVYTNLADVHYVNILSKLSKKGCGCNCSKQCKQYLDQFDFFLNSAVSLFYIENYTLAAKVVLVLDDMRTRNGCEGC